MNVTIRPWIAVVLACGAFGLAACGGGDDQEQPELTEAQAADVKAIQQLGSKLAATVKAKKPAPLCARIAPSSLKKQFGTAAKCSRFLKAQLVRVTDKPQFELGAITLESGDRAVAEQLDGAGPINFVKVDGKWYIDLFPESTSGS